MDERTAEPDKSYDLPSLLSGMASVGEHLGLLSQYDHTNDPDRRIAGEDELKQAEDHMKDLLSFFEGDAVTKYQRIRAFAISELSQTLDGFEFRRKNKLPGLSTQFDEARKQLVTGQKPTALETLARQPDAAKLVEQLRAEYETFEEVMDQGGELDLDKLEGEVYKMNHGLDFARMDDTIGRYRALRDLERKVAGSAALAKVQERDKMLVRLAETTKKFESDVAVQAALNLDHVLGRLKMDGKIGVDDDEGFEFAGKVARLRYEHKGVELVSEMIKRADVLTGGTGLSDSTPIQVDKLLTDFEALTKEAETLTKSLERIDKEQRMWGKIKFLGDRIREDRQRVMTKLTERTDAQNRAEARMEIAENYNSLVAFLSLVRREQEATESQK